MTIEMTPTLQALDWCGSALGLLGAYTLAFRMSVSRYGWLAFFAANVIYIVMASKLGVPGLLAQQVGYVGSSTIGIYRHFISRAGDRLEAARDTALRISLELAQISPEIDKQVPEELVRLIQQARQLQVQLAQPAQRQFALQSLLGTSRRGLPS